MLKKIFMPDEIKYIIDRLISNGYDAYIVGGCVRDSIMCVDPKDWDITTSATPDETMHVFFDHRVIPTGIKHGTVTVCIGDTMSEVTTFRTESGYSDGRHPDRVAFVQDVKEDLMRRDFTVNAMAYNDKYGLIDHFGGCDDIDAGIIRCVGDAQKRFSEDALRILRALRFASVLGFSIDEDTANAAKKLSFTLDKISRERVLSELKKLICGQFCGNIMKSFSDVLSATMPNATFLEKADLIEKCASDLIARLAILFEDTDIITCEKVMTNLRFEKKTIFSVINILPYIKKGISADSFEIKKALYRLGYDDYKKLLTALAAKGDIKELKYKTDEIIIKNECYCPSMLDAGGRDIIELGYKGAEISKCLEAALFAVMRGDIENEKNEILSYIKKNGVV